MKLAIGTTVIDNGTLVDGNGGAPIADGLIIINDGKIAYTGSAQAAPPAPPDAQRIDARGGTIMPGLVEAHFHATYFNVADLPDLDTKYPAEYVTLRAAANCRLALECGQYLANQEAGEEELSKELARQLTKGAALKERIRQMLPELTK